MGLYRDLTDYSNSDMYPMHMPGHKRNDEFLSIDEACKIDITEIDGFDNLHHADGVIKELQDRVAALYGAMESYILVNGSSCGIMSAVCAVCDNEDDIILTRAAHQSAYNAVELKGLNAHYILPQYNEFFGINSAVCVDDVKAALETTPNAKAVLIVSPTYEGVTAPIREIANTVHSNGKLLIVDEAHGAHLGFSAENECSAVTQGADIVIQSLHKTLPAYTQSAVLHICSERVDTNKVRKYLSIFQTTSPSYILMSGIDRCVDLLEKNKDELFNAYYNRLTAFYKSAENFENIKLLKKGVFKNTGYDIGKIYICSEKATGSEIYNSLIRRKIQPEMATVRGCLCMTSVADTSDGFDRLIKALDDIDKELCNKPAIKIPACDFEVPKKLMSASQAAKKETEYLPLCECTGKVSAEYLKAYPPDIPLLVPGEVIDKKLIDRLVQYEDHGIRVHSNSGRFPQALCVIKNI